MQQLLALAERLVLALGLLLVLGVLLVVGNTIRLAIENRRDEIVVVKLVGGTNAFVRRPFLYTGIWYGVGGGLLAWILLMLAIGWLSGPVGQLATLYQSDFYLQGLGFSGSLAMLLLAALVGWIGAWLAVARHLGQINPQ
jgi:cell division transport system permease protein